MSRSIEMTCFQPDTLDCRVVVAIVSATMTGPNLHTQYRRAYLRHMHNRSLYDWLDTMDSDSDSDSDSSSSSSSESDAMDTSSDSSSSSSDESREAEEQEMDDDWEHRILQMAADIEALKKIQDTRYLRGRGRVVKAGQFNLLIDFALSPEDHNRFVDMVRVSPYVFASILELIEDNPIFHNNSPNPQEPVELQLAVALYRLGRYGNGASVKDVARVFGIGDGTAELYTERCMTAIESLQHLFVRQLTAEEKEVEKEWMDKQLGFRGLWREGYIMYDGTIVVIFNKPARDGTTYYTRKSNYGLNTQIGNAPSNLRILDFCHGPTGSAHDASAFKYTCAALYPSCRRA
ncbi:hypothetical protein CYLTODRAFT_441951 [Cylindrobasidium torrendii FP15055 ss-10]|uniref:DDE Tnp4 domain-containing protein n=1 Tax=Cylindrobasidium torrendii FP15055 ss-10 TaxID=1314674 RepID=A0A0D7BJ59_9AGAR|nr:hypothetical protein CYLTODRAFT_441951 [Cylindrobasidium torrendii FP15055 ss-10]